MSSHGCSRITSLTPTKWVGPTRNLAITLGMPVQRDTSIKPHFHRNVKCKKTLWQSHSVFGGVLDA